MVNTNVNQLSLRQLRDLQAKISMTIDVARDRERAKLIQKWGTIAEKRGFTLRELVGVQGRRKFFVPKYINPENRSETWTGRGRRPKWLITKIRKGRKLEHFAA